jgi:hypothetical protein
MQIVEIHRLGMKGPERPMMTTTKIARAVWKQAAESRSATPRGLCNVTSDGADGAGHAASKAYRHIADTKEGSGLRDEQGALSEGDLDGFVA